MALKKRKQAELPEAVKPKLEALEVIIPVEELEKTPKTLTEFEAAEHNPFCLATLMQSVAYIHSVKDNLTSEMVSLLSSCIPHNLEEDISLDDLVSSQLHSAVALKNSYFNPNGSLKEGTSSKDAKDALGSCQQIINVLMKQQEGLDRQSRLVKMENILIQCAMDLPKEAKQVFLDEVARQLEIQL